MADAPMEQAPPAPAPQLRPNRQENLRVLSVAARLAGAPPPPRPSFTRQLW
jgi:hypothetical protein